ncbi:hypothetical protein OAL99_05135 [Gammaproteobacteria bacterium]|nr:hypothetical protein [Gammaproteobacteria bacterium]
MKINQLLISLSVVSLFANASLDDDVRILQNDWAIANYQTDDSKKEVAFQDLIKKAHEISERNHNSAEVLTWEAIILSTYAGVSGGLSALGYVEEAKEKLDKAKEINPNVLNGSIYTSLGSLYYQVPGWPVSFGDDDKAKENLNKALSINPNGIDPNYFYGDFLLSDGEYKEAIIYFEKALNAPKRTGREVADIGRVDEIKTKLKEAKSKL